MFKIIKKLYSDFDVLKFIILIFALMAVFSHPGGRFIFVKAYNNKAHIFPGTYLIADQDIGGEIGEYDWKNVSNSFSQDLSARAEINDFTKENSAYIISSFSEVFNFEEIDSEPAEDNPDDGGAPASAGNESNGQDDSIDGAADESVEGGELEIINKEEINSPENIEEDEAIDIIDNFEPTQKEDSGTVGQEEKILIQDENKELNEELKEEISIGGMGALLKNLRNKFFYSAFVRAEPVANTDLEKDSFYPLKKSIIYSNFSVPLSYQENGIGEISLRLSLAAASGYNSDNLRIDYSTDDNWQTLGTIRLEGGVSNQINNDYFKFVMPQDITWDNIGGLRIKINYINNETRLGSEDKDLRIFLDALWLDVDYNDPVSFEPETGTAAEDSVIESREDSGEIVRKKINNNAQIKLSSEEIDFTAAKEPRFNFKYRKINRSLAQKIGATLLNLFSDEYRDIAIRSIISDGRDQTVPQMSTEVKYLANGEFELKIVGDKRKIKPGKYKIKIEIEDQGEYCVNEQEFTWGVLAFNTNKSIYLPEERAFLQMAVLDDLGHTLCRADLVLEITAPDGGVAVMSTGNGAIIRNSECGPDNFIDTPDYYAYYGLAGAGDYLVKLTAETGNGKKEIFDQFEVRDHVPFEIERVGPTRIYPWAAYSMKFNVKSNEDYIGIFRETIPSSFEAGSKDKGVVVTERVEDKEITWHVNWKKGQTYSLSYVFDAPNLSPEFYLLGPAKTNNFSEARQWQIASDAEIKHVLAENIAVDTGTTDTVNWTEIANASSTSFAGSDTYFVYVTAGFAGSGAAVSTDFRILYGAQTQYTGFIEAPASDDNDAYQISWFDVFTQPSTPVDVSIEYRTNSGRSYALNTQVFSLNLSDLDAEDWKYASNTPAGADQHTTTMVSKAGITLDSADSIKDWLVFAMEEVIVDADGRNFEGEIYDGTNSYMSYSREGEHVDELLPYVIFRPFDDVAQDTQFSIRVRDDQAGVNDHAKSRIFALNLDAFESHKTHYADVAYDISTTPSWTEIGNLNSGGNYAPGTTGDQFIFASWINDAASAAAGTDDRLQVNSTTYPAGWSWAQSPVNNRTTYDTTDEPFNNIFAKVSIPDTGYAIELDATEMIAAQSQVADEVSITVFSAELFSLTSNPPVGSFITASTSQKRDGSGTVDIGITASDPDYDELRAKIEFATGTSCVFSPAGDPTLDEADANTTAVYQDPQVENDNEYQIGNATGYIYTASGTNSVFFDWNSKTDLPQADDYYCLRLTLNDTIVDQATPATTTIIIDNKPPADPGSLSLIAASGTSVILGFGATTTETNFDQYIIYYKEYDGTSPLETDDKHGTTSDANLGYINYNGAASTTIGDLFPSTQYIFNIWAYDSYGNKASATMDIIATTSDQEVPPILSINSLAQKTDGSGIIDISLEADDGNDDDVRVKMEYAAGSACDFTSSLKPVLDDTDENISADFGDPDIDNNSIFQIGTSSAWIKTASGSNSVLFDWLTKNHNPDLDGTYCVQFTANDGADDQANPATSTLIIDNTAPTAPGQLSEAVTTGSSITLNFGASSTEANFLEYIIYYKEYDGTSPEETDNKHSTSSDSNLGYINYYGAASTTISGLDPETQYVFSIWSYDQYGYKSSSSPVSVTTAEAERIRARTVMFPAGFYSGNGSTGKNSDTDHTFSAFNFKLAESGVDIKNAYIIFEAQFEAYNNNAGNYTGYNLAFDSCQESCTASAFVGSGRVLKDDDTVLAYDETESNQTRLLLDVTAETQIASYGGNGANMEGQVGYRIERGGAVDSIANARAVLVITYTYNENDSSNITNTVIYPLESNTFGDSGTRRAVQSDDCVLNSTCPLFTYRMEIPEFSDKLADWFLIYTAVDRNSGVGGNYDYFKIDVNIQGEDINSDAFIYELDNGVTQSHPGTMQFSSVYGFSENSTSTLEYRAECPADSVNYYLAGGEAYETYVSPSSAQTKIRTVSFPVGVINNGLTTAETNAAVQVYFPENGSGSGIVEIKKAWFRIISSNHLGAGTISVSSRVGDNSQSGNYVYNYDTDTSVAKPSFNIIHVIPASDYNELQSANASTSKAVTVYTTNNNAAQGGISAELMITYAYSSETSGYLTSLNLFAGQSDTDGNAQLATTTAVANSVLPELYGTKTMLAGAVQAHYSVSDSDGDVPAAAFTYDANIGASVPTCSNAYNSRPDDSNIFTEFYKAVASALTTVDNQSYIACYSNNGGGAGTAGAKMNGILIYNYSWEAPPPKYTQNDWRWYENVNALEPTAPMADENTQISNVNLADILRLRTNIGLTIEPLPNWSQSFRLQYAQGADCPVISAWQDVGATTSGSAWRFYDNSSVADESNLSGTLLASSTVNESYEESNPSKLNPTTIPENGYGEWDWAIYNYAASSSSPYCFRMILGDGTELDYYPSNSYAKVLTAPANTKPDDPDSLGQYLNDEITIIANKGWINKNSVKLTAAATDPNINESLSLYFQLILNTSSFTTATSAPGEFCPYGTAYESCTANRIWAATSTSGDYRNIPFTATTSITAIPDSTAGYKWQVLACDAGGECSGWVRPASSPNFKVDITPPTPPGNLYLATTSPTSITINFGATTTEDNFEEYRMYYKIGSSGVTQENNPHYDLDFNNKYFNYTSSTTVYNLAAGTQYVFNIWAHDLAGNMATATVELVATTSSSFTPPTGTIFSAAQKTDGSGAVDIAILVDDPDNDDTLRAMIEYEAGGSCLFSPASDPTIDPLNVSDTHESPPDIDNDYPYQVGTTSGWIKTSPGPNFVFFDWLSKADEPSADGTYCLRLTVNDGLRTQDIPATKKFIIDNTPPDAPGPLALHSKNRESITVDFSDFSSDTWFDRYRIFYSTSTPATLNDYEYTGYFGATSTSFYGIGSTTISSLLPGTLYYINIFAFDSYGNSASATPELAVTTNSVPTGLSVGGQFRDDGITAIANGEWINSSSTLLTASTHDPDTSELLTIYFNFILNNDTFKSATTVPSGACVYGTPFGDCDSKIWFVASSSPGDYSAIPYVATTSITAIPGNSLGYKWQVLACDDDNDCADEWVKFNDNIPNINIDITAPTSPGALSEYGVTSRSITLSFGSQTNEDNFTEYKIYYSTTDPVTEADMLFSSTSDPSLGLKNYGLAATTTISGLDSNTYYYFAIWAYDRAGNKASSSVVEISTNAVVSTPGAVFYTKNDQTLYYRVWTGTGWNTEQAGPTLGSAAGDNIRHVRALRSDDGTRIAILAKTWDGANQEWWGTIYRVAADDFVDSYQLGAAYNSNTNNQLITGCIGALSDGEFFVVRNNNGSNGTLVFSWNAGDSWTDESAGPDPGGVLNGCRLVRRPDTDNYLLMTFDDSNHGGQNNGDVGSAYYYGGSAYANSWTTWVEHGYPEEDTDNYVGEAFFDPSDNTRGAINYSGSNNTAAAKIKKFICTDNSINYGAAIDSPATWSGDFVHGEFSADPGGTATAFYAGDDVNGELNVYLVNISTSTPSWYASANGDNISGTGLYSYANDTQKPYAISFYKNNYGIVAWNESVSATPKYRTIDSVANSVSAADTAVPGADANVWSRVRIYNDPFENEFVAIYQNDDVDYSAVFWDGISDAFYDDASGQAWTELAANAGPADYDDECTTFAFTAGNSVPNAPYNMIQYKSDSATMIVNGNWTDERTVNFTASARDSDTSEVLAIYLQLILNNDYFATSTGVPLNACPATTAFGSCDSNIWQVATSTAGDYSINPFIATATITLIPDSGTLGYKWQVKVCDDDNACSGWTKYNLNTPNFKVDATSPTAPGQLTPASKTSTSVVLNFGATTTEDNFLEYRIFYSTTSPVAISDNEHSDDDLDNIFYNYTTDTEVSGLNPSTLYHFNIWAYDQAGNSASSTMISTTTNDTYNLAQTSYIWENDDGADVDANTAAAAADSPLTDVYIGERINLRIQIENSGGDTAWSKTYKLKYENQTDDAGNWQDVGAATPISHSWGLSGDDGDPVSSSTAAANDKLWADGNWHEGAYQTISKDLENGYYTEFVFALKTNNAAAGKTYRLSLFNQTDDSPLDSYLSTSTISIVATDAKRYSKGIYAGLPANSSDLTYYLDPMGYYELASDDSSRDTAVSTGDIPVFNFVTGTTTNTYAINAVWNGQSSLSAASSTIVLQVYRFGSTEAWVTMAQNSTSSADTDFDLSANINSSLSEYYDITNRTYWRVYQESGSITLRSDYFDVSFSQPIPETAQIHYRWREDNGSEADASWLEEEDTGSPTASSSLEKGENIRLRLEFANFGGGSAAAYSYRLEFASSTGDCSSDPGGWAEVPTDDSGHWKMGTSTYFATGDTTTFQLDNTEMYGFESGFMVEHPSSTSSPITLGENDYTEVEYVIQATASANSAGTYCFRATNNGAALDIYAIFPVITLSGVTNTAPSFTVYPSDNNSASTSPTHYGSLVDFTATAIDAENDNYYLAICKTGNIAAGNDGPPVCGGGSWCVSGLASSTKEASCSYSAATSSELLPWFAYVCDKYPGFAVAKCSQYSQGSSTPEDQSPFAVNHAPVLISVSTTDDNKDPGGRFTVTTVSYDNDSAGGADTLNLYVCTENNAGAGGCLGATNQTICFANATSSPNAACYYQDTAPSPSGTTTYYAFIFDNHDFGSSTDSRSGTFTINNVPTVLGDLELNGGADITLEFKPATTTVQVINYSVQDLNGCTDLVSATARVYMSDVSGGYLCAANDNNCYHVDTDGCVFSDCTGDSDETGIYTCTADLKYFAVPTDISTENPYEPYVWLSYIQTYDGKNYESTTSPAVEVKTTLALQVAENLINFGSEMFAGENSGINNASTTVVNIGNSPLNVGLAGTNMAGNPSGTIAVGQIKWSLAENFNYTLTGTALTLGGFPVDIAAPKPTDDTGTEDKIYWGIGIPEIADASIYTGVNIFSAILDNKNWPEE